MHLANRVNFKSCFSEIYKRIPLITRVYSNIWTINCIETGNIRILPVILGRYTV